MRTVMGQNVVLAEGNNADSFGKMITLNSSAAMLWNELSGKSFETEDAAGLLVARHGIGRDGADADATRFIQLMADKGLLEQ